jgi:hypothetical protein
MNNTIMANFLPNFSSLAKKFTMTVVSVIDKTDPMTTAALICGFQILFAVYFFILRKTEPMTTNVSNTSADAQPVEEEQPQPLAPIRVPKPRKSFRNLHEYLVNGQIIRHRVRGFPYAYGCYESAIKRIVCADGTFVKSLSAFAVHNIRQNNPNLVNPQADGWARCEVQINEDTWVKANTLAVV